LALTVLIALGFLYRGIVDPAYNWDLIPYVTLAKELRGAGGKHEAYRELAMKVEQRRFLSNTFEKRAYADDAFFQAILPFYRIRPLYILLCSLTGLLIGSDVAATYVVSAVATALAVILSFGIALKLGVRDGWRLAVPICWAVAGGLDLARLSTPDALAALVDVLFVLAMTGSWAGWRSVPLILLAGLAVTARTDSILLVAPLLICEWLLCPRHRPVAILAFVAAAASYFVIQHTSGNYGYVALINFSLVDTPNGTDVPNLVPSLHGYVVAAKSGIKSVLSNGGQQSSAGLYLLAVSLLCVVLAREWRLRASWNDTHLSQRAFILAGALTVFLVGHFVLFPAPWPRHMTVAYVLTGILVARNIQKTEQRRDRGPGGQSRGEAAANNATSRSPI
jgi:hypothetical protein